MSKSKILCFGDSNTYGYKPNPDIKTNPEERYSESERWTMILQALLGEEYLIIEEGLNGRTTNVTGNLKGDIEKNGYSAFLKIYPKHLPVEFLILQLGTNDLKERFNRNSEEIALGVQSIVEQAVRISNEYGVSVPKIVIFSPPLVDERETHPPYRMNGALEKSKEFAKYFKEVSDRNKCLFINLAEFVQSSSVDGLHLDLVSHKIIAELLKEVILNREI